MEISWYLLHKDQLPSYDNDLLIKDGDNYYVGQFITAQISKEECLFEFKMKSNPHIARHKEVFNSKDRIF